MKNFKDYGGLPIGKFDPVKMERLHDVVFDTYSRFEQDPLVRDLAFSYRIRDGMTTFRSIKDNVHLRSVVMCYLDVVDYALDLARKPVIAIPKPRILTPAEAGVLFPGYAESGLELRTDSGVEVERVEALQENCRRNPEVMKVVDRYKRSLDSAFEEFNLKFVLNGLMNHSQQFFDIDHPARLLQERVNEAWDNEAYLGLDTLYYNHARRFLKDAERSGEKLDKSELGRFFILQRDELLEAMRMH